MQRGRFIVNTSDILIRKFNPIPRPFPIMGKGRLWRIYPRRLPGNSTARADRQGQAAVKRRCDAPLTARSRLYEKTGGDGDIYHQSHDAEGRALGTKCLEVVTCPAPSFRSLRQFGRLFLFPLVQQSHDLLLHFGGSGLLAKILFQFSGRNNHASILLFLF